MRAGAKKPFHCTASWPETPASRIVGISGSAVERAGAATPSPRSLPALTWVAATGITKNASWVSPEIRLIEAGAAPLYGKCWILTSPVLSRSSSIAMCDMVPAPAEAYASASGRAFASATSSLTVFTGSEGWTVSANG